MANWALLENNEIKELHDILPKSWKNVSGLRLAENDIDFLNHLGWYKVIKVHENYDNSEYQVEKYNYEIKDSVVIETLQLKQREQIPSKIIVEVSFEYKKNIFLQELRQERNRRISESDWTQLNDVQLLFDEDTREKWKIYRQKLRDITLNYIGNDIISLDSVQWPEY